MDKAEYFIQAIKHNAWHRKDWLVEILGIVRSDKIEADPNRPYALFTKSDDTRVTFDPETLEEIPVTGGVPGEPLIDPKEMITIDANSGIENLILKDGETSVETTYGTIIVNLLLLVYPFGNRIPFQHYPYNFKKAEKLIADKFEDSPDNPEDRDPSAIYFDDYLKYSEASDMLRGIGYLVNPSGSERTFTVSPEVIKLRNELYDKHKHELHNPAIISLIAQQLEKADKASMKGDVSEGFFLGGKIWSVARMKTFIMLGIEPTLSTEVPTKPVLKSLAEGWDINAFPDMVNGQRYGSYARGKLTEFGGVIVKLMSQAFRDTSITEDDCGSKEGIPIKVHKNYIKLLEGQYIVGNKEPSTAEELLSKEGEVVLFRSPSRCLTAAPGYCAICVGTKYSKNRRGLSIAATTQGSIFMGISMARMHGKAMKTVELDLNTAFS